MIFKRIDGKPRRITLGHWPEVTPDAARLAFYSRAAALEPNAPIWDAQPSTITFAALSARFMEQRVTHFKPSSVGPFRAYVETQLLPNFGNQSIGEITHAHVAAWFHAYSRQRPGGANQALGHFTTIINWGKSEGHLPHNLPNPAAPIRRNRSIARGRMLNFDQICALACVLTSAEGCHWLPAQAIRLCLLTGCRKGEVLSLQWSHVKTNRLILADAKTGPRDVMLNAPARV
ncbi:site-specific recombinase, phage integrase family protein [Rhodobacterales bacterium HTCC2150]|nr:site-specific recombinase, phage integrase family protein [Rhodobacterales bacterium HTCC2150] [Rhodobacteraceae bacterium HTCC2150]